MSFTILPFLISFCIPPIKFAFLLIGPVQFSLFCPLEIFHDLFRIVLGDVVYFIHFCLYLSWGLILFLGHFSTKTSLKSFLPFSDNPRIGITGHQEVIGYRVTWVTWVYRVHWVNLMIADFGMWIAEFKEFYIINLGFRLSGNLSRDSRYRTDEQPGRQPRHQSSLIIWRPPH